MSTRPAVTLAQRKRQLVSDELSEAALQLLALKGFDGVTIDEIAVAAGVSKRTFFRYFASKEDVVVQFLSGMGEAMRAELAARPAGEPPSVALRHTVQVPVAECADRSDHAERALRVVRLILRTPALRARFLERQAQWRDDLATELGRRLPPGPDTDLWAHLAAGMTLTAFDTVLRRWSDSDGTEDPTTLTDRAFTLLAPALDSGQPSV
ncbi:TetR family transcriptional regulator [Streptomyces aurantiogriseus]|uniref:TetR family transcriptional regulator n=1 Tax=Streptomyces aurantiogriseus TaxID=66870 RepID=A0A918BZR8_9ACTN|nr:TetR family transcriptional regulator [Streptomyces aurantiogriseus]GGQ98760.1 TetR family transcriptional regulator [Streptomyces aurantiogriseus]